MRMDYTRRCWFLPFVLCTFMFSAVLDADDAPKTEARPQSSLHTKLIKKMKMIIIDRIDFKNASLADILQFLTSESRKSDPDHEGVSFVLRTQEGNPQPKPVTLELNSIHLNEALRYSLYLADPNLHYSVGDTAVYVRHDNGEGLYFRTFSVPDGFFHTKLARLGDEEQQLIDKGVKFPPRNQCDLSSRKEEFGCKKHHRSDRTH